MYPIQPADWSLLLVTCQGKIYDRGTSDILNGLLHEVTYHSTFGFAGEKQPKFDSKSFILHEGYAKIMVTEPGGHNFLNVQNPSKNFTKKL